MGLHRGSNTSRVDRHRSLRSWQCGVATYRLRSGNLHISDRNTVTTNSPANQLQNLDSQSGITFFASPQQTAQYHAVVIVSGGDAGFNNSAEVTQISEVIDLVTNQTIARAPRLSPLGLRPPDRDRPPPGPQAPPAFDALSYGLLCFVDLLQTPHANRIAQFRRHASAAALAPLIVVMQGTRYATALRRIAFSSWKLCAPVVV